MTPQSALKADSIRHKLTADHQRLEKLFDDVLRRLALDDRDETRAAWNEFDRGLTAHLDAEEKLILPAFAFAFPEEAAAIRKEHESIRATLLELGVAVDLHSIRWPAAADFVSALRAHATREDSLMYRWAEKNLEETVRAALVRGLLTRV